MLKASFDLNAMRRADLFCTRIAACAEAEAM